MLTEHDCPWAAPEMMGPSNASVPSFRACDASARPPSTRRSHRARQKEPSHAHYLDCISWSGAVTFTIGQKNKVSIRHRLV